MALQILPPDVYPTATDAPLDTQLLFVVLGLAIHKKFRKVAKYLKNVKIFKTATNKVEKPNYTS